MRYFFGILLWLAAAGMAQAQSLAPSCGAAGQLAAAAAALPTNLLDAIGVVESGRLDPATGRAAAWPWTVNVDGAGHYFDSEQEAASFAEDAQASGARDVDVGCFQVSLTYHPGAFASMDAAFDPASNAAFAARFLSGLRAQAGNWNAAIADYHSAVPAFGLPYQQRVLAAWRQLGDLPPDLMTAALLSLPDPTIILEGAAARRVAVITMDGSSGPASGRWLPRVITP